MGSSCLIERSGGNATAGDAEEQGLEAAGEPAWASTAACRNVLLNTALACAVGPNVELSGPQWRVALGPE